MSRSSPISSNLSDIWCFLCVSFWMPGYEPRLHELSGFLKKLAPASGLLARVEIGQMRIGSARWLLGDSSRHSLAVFCPEVAAAEAGAAAGSASR
jgi:hypothetical protein